MISVYIISALGAVNNRLEMQYLMYMEHLLMFTNGKLIINKLI